MLIFTFLLLTTCTRSIEAAKTRFEGFNVFQEYIPVEEDELTEIKMKILIKKNDISSDILNIVKLKEEQLQERYVKGENNNANVLKSLSINGSNEYLKIETEVKCRKIVKKEFFEFIKSVETLKLKLDLDSKYTYSMRGFKKWKAKDKNEVMQELLSRVNIKNAKVIEDKNYISVTGYAPAFLESIKLDDRKINLHVILREKNSRESLEIIMAHPLVKASF